jgi:hypothetical protein
MIFGESVWVPLLNKAPEPEKPDCGAGRKR